MSRRLHPAVGALLVGIALVGTAGGYWLGRRDGAPPPASNVPAPTALAPTAAPAPSAPEPDRAVLYYQDPTGKPDFSPTPKKDAAGHDFVAVYADETAAAPAAPVPAPAPAPVPAKAGQGKILYYRNPMGLPDTSPVPKKDPMGMDYVPVYEGEQDDGATVSISPAKIQTLGVRTEAAELRQMTHTIRAVGTVALDERRVSVVAPRFEGYIERLAVDTTGQAVKRGQPLFETYSPDLVLAQQDYLAAWQSFKSLSPDADPEAREAVRGLMDGALTRLRNWEISDGQIRRLQAAGHPVHAMTVSAPADGIVLEKTALQGMRFMPGEALYRIADLSSVWVIAQVYEQEQGYLQLGQEARLTFQALPGQSFTGRLAFIYPTLDADTRTVKVRIELPNPGGVLKPSFFGNAEIAGAVGGGKTLAVPESALLDSGTRQVVLIERGEGRFEPREVKTGTRADSHVQILEGLVPGDKVVVSANFLIDAESNLRAALQGFHGN